MKSVAISSNLQSSGAFLFFIGIDDWDLLMELLVSLLTLEMKSLNLLIGLSIELDSVQQESVDSREAIGNGGDAFGTLDLALSSSPFKTSKMLVHFCWRCGVVSTVLKSSLSLAFFLPPVIVRLLMRTSRT